jgi:hypothetical protein
MLAKTSVAACGSSVAVVAIHVAKDIAMAGMRTRTRELIRRVLPIYPIH